MRQRTTCIEIAFCKIQKFGEKWKKETGEFYDNTYNLLIKCEHSEQCVWPIKFGNTYFTSFVHTVVMLWSYLQLTEKFLFCSSFDAYLQKEKRKQLINVLKEDCLACILNGKKMFV